MTNAKCGSCAEWIEEGQTVVGMPIIRIVALNKSQLAGTELLFHVRCFLKKMELKKVDTLEVIPA